MITHDAVTRLLLFLEFGHVRDACFIASFFPFVGSVRFAGSRINIFNLWQSVIITALQVVRFNTTHGFDNDGSHTHANHANFLGGGKREVDHSALHEGATVSDTHNHNLSDALVGHLEESSKGKGAVCAGQAVAVVT